MARSAALNPTSMPFFPGSLRTAEEYESDTGNLHRYLERDRSPISPLTVPPPDPHSTKSPPSPPQEKFDNPLLPLLDNSRRSPTYRQLDNRQPYTTKEIRNQKESNVVILHTLPEGDDSQDTPGPNAENGNGKHDIGPSFSFQQERENISTPPLAINHSGSSIPGGAFTSSSPVSSLDSGSYHASSDQPSRSFEAQLKASPLMHEILERLVRYEYSTREIQHDLGEMHRKVNLLVERAIGANSQPEFKDPFSANANGHNFPGVMNHRPSIGNIAPNQSAPSDDITSISQRLNTLTSSVGQLLALQTQQIHSTLNDARNNSVISLNTPQQDIPPNQMMSPPSIAASSLVGHVIPNRSDLRPSPRQPNPPMRTWSAGTLDLPIRPSEPNISRPETLLRDSKRRSVSGLLRRESSSILDSQSDAWASGTPRDSGPIISKWEQLPLAPELLRSLSKFGVGPPNKIQQRALPFLIRGADIIAQAPPTQERIAAYVIPAIQIAVTKMTVRPPNRGPIVIMISTTVDQATQAQRMIRDLGGPIGVKSALGVGAASANNDLTQELRLLQQNMPHIICGTPQKLHALFTSPGGLTGSEVRFLVLDEVDQLIARNLHEFVFNIVKLLPPPRSRPLGTGGTSAITSAPIPISQTTLTSPFESGSPASSSFQNRRYSSVASPSNSESNNSNISSIERQTALFSNTVPQDVLNLATAIQLREPVRVLVRRDGNVTNPEASQGSKGLRQFYLYLAFTAGGRSDPVITTPGGGLGIIGSGRGASNAETAQAREWKLDALADAFDDIDVSQAIVYVGGMTALDSVVYKLASRGLEAIPLHGDMNAGTKLAALNKFRMAATTMLRQSNTKVLVVYDVQVKAPEVSHVPLIINYDLPKAVEEYAHRVAPAIAAHYTRAGVVVNFVTATGGDVEMLRSIECFYKIKCPEVPLSLRDIL